MKKILFFLIAIFLIPQFVSAGSVAVPTQNDLIARYASGGTIKVLIVPGHSDLYPGAIFGKIREADMTRVLAQRLADNLARDPHFVPTVLRTEEGYIKEFLDYYLTKTEEVDDFMNSHIRSTHRQIKKGEIVVSTQAPHNKVSDDITNKLYSINKWAGERGYDMVINLHFNDNWPRSQSARGPYSGFSVYVPETGLVNAESGQALGRYIAKRLDENLDLSNQPVEIRETDDTGVIEDFGLIAIGSYNTLEIPSVVIENSYIYESWLSPKFFQFSSGLLAEILGNGIRDYVLGARVDAKNLTYKWQKDLVHSENPTVDALALQLALSELGFYPPKGKNRDDCSLTGIFWNCTEASIKEFQSSKGIKTTGIFGPMTREVMNLIFSK